MVQLDDDDEGHWKYVGNVESIGCYYQEEQEVDKGGYRISLSSLAPACSMV